MYTTLEVDIENGQIKGPESNRLPYSAHALITLLHIPENKKPNWERIKQQLGKLKLREDTIEWQRNLRNEWRS